MWQISGGVFLGWSLGANDAANVFGTAVSSKMIRYSTAVILCSLFVVLGAWMNGSEGLTTYSSFMKHNLQSAFIVSCAAACTITFMTVLKLPTSTSHAVVGSMIGIGLSRFVSAAVSGTSISLSEIADVSILGKIVLCWVLTPIGAAVASIFFYNVIGWIFNRWNPGLIMRDITLRFLLVAAGAYGAYALGANNVANVTGPFLGKGMLSLNLAILIGSLSIVLGIVTFSKNVMMTVGKNIVPLDAFTAFIAILSEAVTVHIFALIGVPVSTSQAIVGAVIGIGFIKGMRVINGKELFYIGIGWLCTPIISCLLAWGMAFICNLVTG